MLYSRQKKDVDEIACNYLLPVTIFMLHQRDIDSPSDDEAFEAEDTRQDRNDDHDVHTDNTEVH